MRPTRLLLLILFAPTFVFAQQIPEKSWQTNSALRAHVRSRANEFYQLNSEIGYITFFEQGHPHKRQDVLNGNIVPHYDVSPRHWKMYFVLTPQVIVRIIANQNSLPRRKFFL